jgi:hypothetical protein
VKPGWEYRVEELGSTWQVVKLSELEALLNNAAEERWEPTIVTMRGSGNRILIILRRQLERRSRAKSRTMTWP